LRGEGWGRRVRTENRGARGGGGSEELKGEKRSVEPLPRVKVARKKESERVYRRLVKIKGV